MGEGKLMETLIVAGAVITVLTAVGATLYRITVGDAQTRRLEKLKKELERNPK